MRVPEVTEGRVAVFMLVVLAALAWFAWMVQGSFVHACERAGGQTRCAGGAVANCVCVDAAGKAIDP